MSAFSVHDVLPSVPGDASRCAVICTVDLLSTTLARASSLSLSGDVADCAGKVVSRRFLKNDSSAAVFLGRGHLSREGRAFLNKFSGGVILVVGMFVRSCGPSALPVAHFYDKYICVFSGL